MNAVPPDLRGEDRPEPVPWEPHGLMRAGDTALVQQILDILQ
jgi:hypothetical protein